MKRYWIWLTTRSKVRDSEIRALLSLFGDAYSIFRASAHQLQQAANLSAEAITSLCDKNLQKAESLYGYCNAQGIEILTCDESRYSQRLLQIADPPPVLYCKGKLPNLNQQLLLGVVGTRKTTPYGERMAKTISAELAAGGAVVVSGMAKGIDACATCSAIQADSPVIGVLGCSVDRIYPASNRELFRQMETKGCLLSEYPPGSVTSKWSFPRRNRIISGLSHGVLVVEAPEKSGALITAQHAVEQGRDVFVVPHNADEPLGVGCNQLLRSGAVPVSTGREILQEYVHLFPNLNLQATKPVLEAFDKKFVDNAPNAPYSDVVTPPSLSLEEQRVLAAMQPGRQMLDELMDRLEMPSAKIMSILTMLSVKKLVANLPGGIVEKL